ncbi:TPA: hypothetical protein ACH3X3_004277 [Trebouxia sp. C0006]
MRRFLQVSCQLCKIAVNREMTSQYPSMLQQAPGLALSRYFSIMSLRDWARQSAPCKVQSSASLDIHQSTFAVQAMQTRGMKRLMPKFKGGKLKPYSSYKERFKTTATGLILFKRPGHRHKRFSKGPHRNRQLRRTQVLTNAYTATMQRLGFVSRRF